jgi:hypothetical protein
LLDLEGRMKTDFAWMTGLPWLGALIVLLEFRLKEYGGAYRFLQREAPLT